MLKVAARFGVSSSYMARVCTRLNVPRPERGYWAKLEVGKAPEKKRLPDAQPGDELVWSRDGEKSTVRRALPVAPKSAPKIRLAIDKLATKEHPLVKGAKTLFASGRLSYDIGYLKPAKRLLVDLAVSSGALDKALLFANQLFMALEAKGYRVVFAPLSEHFRREEVDEREKPTGGRG